MAAGRPGGKSDGRTGGRAGGPAAAKQAIRSSRSASVTVSSSATPMRVGLEARTLMRAARAAVLLRGMQRQARGRVPLPVTGDAGDPAGKVGLVGVAGGEEGGVRPAVA